MALIEIFVIFIFPVIAIINVIYEAFTWPEQERQLNAEIAQRTAEREECQRRDEENRKKAIKEFNEAYSMGYRLP